MCKYSVFVQVSNPYIFFGQNKALSKTAACYCISWMLQVVKDRSVICGQNAAKRVRIHLSKICVNFKFVIKSWHQQVVLYES